MNTKCIRVQNAVGLALIATGLIWGVAEQVSVHAQQSGTSETAPGNVTVSTTPKLENAKLQVQQLNGPLSNAVSQWAVHTTRAEWLGYSVAEVRGKHSVGCWHGENGMESCRVCHLEGERSGSNIVMQSDGKPSVKLEGPDELIVLYRAESGKIGQIRMVSSENTLDAGGLTFVWLQGVKPSESVSLLEKFVRDANAVGTNHNKLGQGALAAIALHADLSAERVMESFVSPNEPASLRKEASFWLGEARGAEGLRVLQRMAQSDASPEVREQVAFALSISPEPGALTELIRMAHDDQIPKVRGQALFWLGQKAGQKASNAITSAIESDPDTDVKKKAVFALSQMPKDEGVPKLIQVAETNHNPVVRKEAMFWLGQSGDPQALAFFEKILSQ
jgi:hypothetical protein